MSETITAIYENGALYPTIPLPFKERQSVQIQVLPRRTDSTEAETLMQTILDMEVVTPPSNDVTVEIVSVQERSQLQNIVLNRPSKLASELIIEERNEQ